MATPSALQEEVREHYRELATTYDDRANRTCEKTYQRLIHRFLKGRGPILELGSGCKDNLSQVCNGLGVASDLSLEMLRRRPVRNGIHGIVTAGERLPFRDASFDAVFSINVLEHVADLDNVVRECGRVLRGGGLWLAITPNGNWQTLLDLAERWKLKIPEGPHCFLTTQRLRQVLPRDFEIVEHRTFLVLPAGSAGLARCLDRLTCCSALGWGFFQYLVARKREAPQSLTARQ
jgi:ubiquinone/menaquinone biosynthesis C-methylase UbiE